MKIMTKKTQKFCPLSVPKLPLNDRNTQFRRYVASLCCVKNRVEENLGADKGSLGAAFLTVFLSDFK